MKKEIFISLSLGIGLFFLLQWLYPTLTPYDYYAQLGQALLSGRLCLTQDVSWLNELVFIANKGYCVVYPLTPALLFIPFFLLSLPIAQTTLAHLFFALTGCVIYTFFRKQKLTIVPALLLALAWCLGTIFFSMSAVGSAWYLAQTTGSFFIWLALFFFNPTKKTFLLLSGLCVGLAASSRLPLHLYYIYFLLHLFWQNKPHWKNFVIAGAVFTLGFLPFFSLQRGYNFARYGTFGDAGYYLIPGKFSEQDFKAGEFNIINIPKHLQIFALKLPKRVSTFPYLVPSYYGLSIFVTSPFLVLALLFLLRNRKIPELLTILGTLGLEMTHGTVGFTQFGYRFALDVYPLLFLGLPDAYQLGKKRRVVLLLLILFSIAVNYWGVLSFKNNWFIW